MVALTRHRIGSSGKVSARVLHLPLAFCEGVGLAKGQVVEILYGDVLVVIPRPSPHAERVRLAMAEAG